MKTYTGRRTRQGCIVTVRGEGGGLTLPLDPRLDLENHSSTGPEWGYAGSGPAQLALALAADATGDDKLARAVHQLLKWKLVVGLPHDYWTLTQDDIVAMIRTIRKEDE